MNYYSGLDIVPIIARRWLEENSKFFYYKILIIIGSSLKNFVIFGSIYNYG